MSKRDTILIVDDETEICSILQKVLNQEGYYTLAAQSGPEVLKLLRKEKIDLLLLDLKMPGMDGFQIMEEIKKSQLKKSPAVLILTAHGSLSSAREAMARGAIDYITKPFDLEEVKAIVREALSDR